MANKEPKLKVSKEAEKDVREMYKEDILRVRKQTLEEVEKIILKHEKCNNEICQKEIIKDLQKLKEKKNNEMP